jgi:dihydropyrimidinase
VWDPEATKTISTKTDHQNVDYNIFEGMEIKGCPSHTLSQGKVVYAGGELDVQRGAGRYVNRPPFAAFYDALQKQARLAEPVAVKR